MTDIMTTTEDWLDDILRGVIKRVASKYRDDAELQNVAECSDEKAEEFDAKAMTFLLREAVAGDRLASDLFLQQVLNR